MQSVTSRRARPRRSRHLRRALLIAATIMLVGGIATFALIPEHGETPSVAPPAHVVITTTTTHPRPIDHRNAIQRENARPGTTSWHIRPLTIFGPSAYADHVSAQHGDEVTLYVTSVMPTFSVEAYRMGWYQGTGARLVWRSPAQRARTQPDGRLLAETRTFTTHWTPSLHLTVPASWQPGDYLLKVSDANGDTYVPLTVRDDPSHAPVLVVNAVTTWQAYNDYGGYSLYHGPGLNARTRSTVVTFDRPYSRDGAGDFIANELGLVALAERMGLDVTYTTDIDLHEHPELLTNHKVIISLGHDEYWSKTMRDGVEAARDKGVNVMFLGANALYRRIRLDPSPLGPDRLEVNYRTVAGDTYYQQTKQEPTTEWRAAPQARPESSLTGTFYECNPVNVDGVVADASSWVFAGTGLHNGDHLKLLIGTEYDRVTAGVPTPPDIEVLLHSPLRCGGRRSFADAAYYTAPSGAGVFDAGTGAWVCKLFSGCPADKPFRPDPIVQRITENLLRVFAAGPVGRTHPSTDNLASLGRLQYSFGDSSSSGTGSGSTRRSRGSSGGSSGSPAPTAPPEGAPVTAPPSPEPTSPPTTPETTPPTPPTKPSPPPPTPPATAGKSG